MKQKESSTRSVSWRILLCLFSFFMSMSMYAQNVTATGTVVDQNGDPLIGVSVTVVGSKVGTATDIDGNFTVKCPVGATLSFSYVGYKPQTEKASATKMNIVMKEDTQMLDDVVVIGYGSVAKRDVTGSITSIDAKKIEERQPTDIFEALQGEVPGLMVSNNSGAPGETGTMAIRGISSMSSEGANPLYIVDGVAVSDISTINPQDIQSMEVLKDAASAAIYGSRSAAGVIIITTKRGEEGKPKINISYSHKIEKLGHKIDQANAKERYLFEQKNAPTNLNLNRVQTDSLNPTQMADNDMLDLVTRTAHTNDISLNVSGSVKDKMNYYASFGFLDQQGIVNHSNFRRFNIRTNVDYNMTKSLKVSTNVELSYTQRNIVDEGVILMQGLRRPAHMALYFPDGSYIYYNGGQRNPVAQADERINERNQYQMRFTEKAEYKFLKHFTWVGQATARYGVTRTDYLNTAKLSNAKSEGRNQASLARYLAGETYLTWNQKFGKHNPYGTIGASIEDWRDEALNIYGSDHVSESIITSNAFQVLNLSNTRSNYSEHSMVGFFARVGYSYDSKYIVNASLRRDGSSRFVGKRWGWFPSVSALWRFSAEPFMKWSRDWLSDAKIRYSYGQTGVQSVGNYDAIDTYTIGHYYNGVAAVYQNSRLANVNLSWESSGMNNVGIDLSFLNGRISFTADWYNKETKDLLASEQIPSEMGVSTMRVNFGSIRNRGLELSVNGYPIQTRNFSWQTGFNISFNENEITKLADGTAYLENNMYWIEEGGSIGQWFGYKYKGIYASDEANAYVKNADGTFGERLTPVYERDPNNYNNWVYGSNGKPKLSHYETSDGKTYDGEVGKMTAQNTVAGGGDVIWEDLNHDGVIGDADRMNLGKALPTTYFGWQNTITYKAFSLSFSFYGSFGNKIYDKMSYDMNQFSSSNHTPLAHYIYPIWKYQGQITTMYKGTNATQGVKNARVLSSQYLHSGDYLRLDNVRFTYRMPRKISAKFLATDFNVYVYGKNLATWTNYPGFDPSNISNSNPLQPGIDGGRYPRSKELGFGFNLTF